jgi:hypothetical protein
MTDTKSLDMKARRAARRAGLLARKSRWRVNTVDNYGGFMLVNARHNWVVAGSRFDLSAAEVLEYCAEDNTA